MEIFTGDSSIDFGVFAEVTSRIWGDKGAGPVSMRLPPQKRAAGVMRGFPEFFFNAQQLIVFRGAVGARK